MPDTPEFLNLGQEFYSTSSAEGDDILQDWLTAFTVGDEDGFTVESIIEFSTDPYDVLKDGNTVTTDLGDGNRFFDLLEKGGIIPAITSADAGSFTLTGQDAELLHNIAALDGGTGDFNLTGLDADFSLDYYLDAELGDAQLPDKSFQLTGLDAALSAPLSESPARLNFALTGLDTELRHGYTLDADAGSFALTGLDASFLANAGILVDAGAFTLTGLSAGLVIGYTIDAAAGAFTFRGEDIESLAPTSETFYFNLIVDMFPAQTGANYQNPAETLTVGATTLKIKSWAYDDTPQDAGKLDIELANVAQRSLVTKDADITFTVRNNFGTTETLLGTGYLGRTDYTLSRAGIGSPDSFTFTGLSEMSAFLKKVPANNTIYYDPSKHSVEAADFEGIYDAEGNYTPPDVTAVSGQTLESLFEDIFVDICGFVRVRSNLQTENIPVAIIEFTAGKPYAQAINGLIGMYEAVYTTVAANDGLELWIMSGYAETPPDFPAPRQITVSNAVDLGAAAEHNRIDALILSVTQERFTFDYYTDRSEQTTAEYGGELPFPSDYIEVTTSKVWRDFYRNSRPTRPVKTELKSVTKTYSYQGLTDIQITTEDFTYDQLGRETLRVKTLEGLLPNPLLDYDLSMLEYAEERETFTYRTHLYEPRSYYLAEREINKAGRVVIDSDNQQLGEDYYRDLFNAVRAGNVVDTMTSEWLKISTFREIITPMRNRKVKIRAVEIDYLVNPPFGAVVSDEEDIRDGEIGVNIFVNEQQKIVLYAPGVTEIALGTEEINMGELPLDIALSLGAAILRHRTTYPNRVGFTVPGLDTSLQKGTAVNARGWSGEDLGNYIIESRQFEGRPDGYFTTIQCRQSGE